MLNLPAFSSLTHHASIDCRTQQHIILQTTCTQNEGSKMIVLSSYSLSIYIPTAQACPSSQNNKSLLLLLFSILLQHEPSYLSDAAEIQDIAEVLMLQRSSLLKFFFFQNCLSLFFHYRLLWCLIYLLTICSISYTPFYSLHCPKLSLPPTDSWSFILRGLLLLPDAFPKLSVPIKSDPESAVSTP
jgi:hypothetical protein